MDYLLVTEGKGPFTIEKSDEQTMQVTTHSPRADEDHVHPDVMEHKGHSITSVGICPKCLTTIYSKKHRTNPD